MIKIQNFRFNIVAISTEHSSTELIRISVLMFIGPTVFSPPYNVYL